MSFFLEHFSFISFSKNLDINNPLALQFSFNSLWYSGLILRFFIFMLVKGRKKVENIPTLYNYIT